jgi:hypothetical protein
MSDQSKYDQAGNASHYDNRINTLVLIERTWGTYEAMVFCEITAFKYRARIGRKDDPALELTKLKWYETQAKRLQLLLGTDQEVKHPREQPNVLVVVEDIKRPTKVERKFAWRGLEEEVRSLVDHSTTKEELLEYIKKWFKPKDSLVTDN